jgi:hypothetical protein
MTGGDFEDYWTAEEEAYRQAKDTGDDWCVIADDDEGTYRAVTDPEAQRFAEDERYRIVYAARPYRYPVEGEDDETGVCEVHGQMTE